MQLGMGKDQESDLTDKKFVGEYEKINVFNWTSRGQASVSAFVLCRHHIYIGLRKSYSGLIRNYYIHGEESYLRS
jgi:hypothetical protein